jgi:DNA-binding transcriptional ArsR family regulator
VEGVGQSFTQMGEYLDTTFAALSHATRRDILARLTLGESTVGDIAAPYQVSLNTISKHLTVLEQAGLVTRRIEGRVHHLRLNPEPLGTASEWLQLYRSFWEQRLDALDDFLSRKARKKGTSHGTRSPHHAKARRPTRRGL